MILKYAHVSKFMLIRRKINTHVKLNKASFTNKVHGTETEINSLQMDAGAMDEQRFKLAD